MDLVASRQEVLDSLAGIELQAEPLRVVTKRDEINTPCVYVALDGLDHYLAGGSGEIAWRLYLVVANTDDDQALEDLNDLLDVVLPHVSPADLTQYVGLRVPEQPDTLPALFIKVTNTN